MSNPGKALFSLFLLLIVVVYIVNDSDIRIVDSKKTNYRNAIQAASQIATMDIMDSSDVNSTYDGVLKDPEDIAINFSSLNTFRSTLDRILKSYQSDRLADVSNINIPLVGYITYDYIIGVTYGEPKIDANTLSSIGYTYDEYISLDDETRYNVDSQLINLSGAYLLPMGYNYYFNNSTGIVGVDNNSEYSLDEIDGKIVKFTLGDSIYIPSEIFSGTYDDSGKVKISEGRYLIGNDGKTLYKVDLQGKVIEDVYYDMSDWLDSIDYNTLFEFRDYVVTSAINNYLNNYSGAIFSNTALNTGNEVEFQLNMVGYDGGFTDYTGKSSVIDSPGMFAIVDVYTGTKDNNKLYERIATFGGSELSYILTDTVE